MTNLDDHADALIAYNQRLVEGGLDAQVAGVLTIDISKALVAGLIDRPAASTDEQKSERAAAADAKRQARADQLAKLEPTG